MRRTHEEITASLFERKAAREEKKKKTVRTLLTAVPVFALVCVIGAAVLPPLLRSKEPAPVPVEPAESIPAEPKETSSPDPTIGHVVPGGESEKTGEEPAWDPAEDASLVEVEASPGQIVLTGGLKGVSEGTVSVRFSVSFLAPECYRDKVAETGMTYAEIRRLADEANDAILKAAEKSAAWEEKISALMTEAQEWEKRVQEAYSFEGKTYAEWFGDESFKTDLPLERQDEILSAYQKLNSEVKIDGRTMNEILTEIEALAREEEREDAENKEERDRLKALIREYRKAMDQVYADASREAFDAFCALNGLVSGEGGIYTLSADALASLKPISSAGIVVRPAKDDFVDGEELPQIDE